MLQKYNIKWTNYDQLYFFFNKKRVVPKVFKSMIAPHTFANFKSLQKLIIVIVKYFHLNCKKDLQNALTKQNFSDSLLFFFTYLKIFKQLVFTILSILSNSIKSFSFKQIFFIISVYQRNVKI